MRKTKVTRSLMAACSIVALTAVMYGCVHSSSDDGPTQADLDAAAAAQAAAEAEAAAAEEARKKAEEEAAAAEEDKKAAEEEAQRLQDEADAAAAAKASADAKDLLNMALKDVDPTADTDPDTDGDQLITAPSVTLSVSNDGMLSAKAKGYTMSDMAPDMIEGWRGAMLTNAGGDTAVVYSVSGTQTPYGNLG